METVITLLEQALAILRTLVSSSEPDPVEHDRPPVSNKYVKLAVIVGHNERAKGAYSATLGSEYDFNLNGPAKYIEEAAIKSSVTVRVFRRVPADSYAEEMENLAKQVDAWNPDAAVSLHFNAFRTSTANGSETLHSSSAKSKALATIVHKCVLDCFGLNNRFGDDGSGLIQVSRTGRGSGFIYGVDAPAILLEPGFGTNLKDSLSLKKNWPSFAEDLIWAVKMWYDEHGE